MDPKTIKENKDNDRKYIDSYHGTTDMNHIEESAESEELEYFTE